MKKLIQNLSIKKSREQNLPDFIIIGGMKCGTTSLHYYLNCHPEISMSQEKELNFFIKEKNWDRGIEWYKSQFTGTAKVYGEASPNYTNYPKRQGVSERLYSIVPHAKLIYIVRDPIERIISDYVHLYASGIENKTITEALNDFQDNPYNRYVYRSCYYLQLEQYLRYFSPSNILILTTEELSNNPQDTLQTIFRFLGVTENVNIINYKKKLHKSIYKRRNTNLGNALAKFSIMTQINHLPPSLRDHINKLIYFPFSTAVKKPKLEIDLQNRLTNYLKKDIDRLRKYTGKSFDEWCI